MSVYHGLQIYIYNSAFSKQGLFPKGYLDISVRYIKLKQDNPYLNEIDSLYIEIQYDGISYKSPPKSESKSLTFSFDYKEKPYVFKNLPVTIYIHLITKSSTDVIIADLHFNHEDMIEATKTLKNYSFSYKPPYYNGLTVSSNTNQGEVALSLSYLSFSEKENQSPPPPYINLSHTFSENEWKKAKNYASNYGKVPFTDDDAEIIADGISEMFGDHECSYIIDNINLDIKNNDNNAIISLEVLEPIKYETTTLKCPLYESKNDVQVNNICLKILTRCKELESNEKNVKTYWKESAILNTSLSIAMYNNNHEEELMAEIQRSFLKCQDEYRQVQLNEQTIIDAYYPSFNRKPNERDELYRNAIQQYYSFLNPYHDDGVFNDDDTSFSPLDYNDSDSKKETPRNSSNAMSSDTHSFFTANSGSFFGNRSRSSSANFLDCISNSSESSLSYSHHSPIPLNDKSKKNNTPIIDPKPILLSATISNDTINVAKYDPNVTYFNYSDVFLQRLKTVKEPVFNRGHSIHIPSTNTRPPSSLPAVSLEDEKEIRKAHKKHLKFAGDDTYQFDEIAAEKRKEKLYNRIKIYLSDSENIKKYVADKYSNEDQSPDCIIKIEVLEELSLFLATPALQAIQYVFVDLKPTELKLDSLIDDWELEYAKFPLDFPTSVGTNPLSMHTKTHYLVSIPCLHILTMNELSVTQSNSDIGVCIIELTLSNFIYSSIVHPSKDGLLYTHNVSLGSFLLEYGIETDKEIREISGILPTHIPSIKRSIASVYFSLYFDSLEIIISYDNTKNNIAIQQKTVAQQKIDEIMSNDNDTESEKEKDKNISADTEKMKEVFMKNCQISKFVSISINDIQWKTSSNFFAALEPSIILWKSEFVQMYELYSSIYETWNNGWEEVRSYLLEYYNDILKKVPNEIYSSDKPNTLSHKSLPASSPSPGLYVILKVRQLIQYCELRNDKTLNTLLASSKLGIKSNPTNKTVKDESEIDKVLEDELNTPCKPVPITKKLSSDTHYRIKLSYFNFMVIKTDAVKKEVVCLPASIEWKEPNIEIVIKKDNNKNCVYGQVNFGDMSISIETQILLFIQSIKDFIPAIYNKKRIRNPSKQLFNFFKKLLKKKKRYIKTVDANKNEEFIHVYWSIGVDIISLGLVLKLSKNGSLNIGFTNGDFLISRTPYLTESKKVERYSSHSNRGGVRLNGPITFVNRYGVTGKFESILFELLDCYKSNYQVTSNLSYRSNDV